MLKRRNGLKKRALAFVLAVLMVTVTIDSTAISALADEAVMQDGMDSKAAFESIADYLLDEGSVSEEDGQEEKLVELTKDSYVSLLSLDEERVISLASKLPGIETAEGISADNTMEILIPKNSSKCEIKYSFYINNERFVFSMETDRESLTEDTDFSLISLEKETAEELTSLVNSEVKEQFLKKVTEWNEKLDELTGADLRDLGFTGLFEEEEETESFSDEISSEVTSESTEETSETETYTEEASTEESSETEEETLTSEETTEETSEETSEETGEETTEELSLEETEEVTTTEEELTLEAAYEGGVERIGLNLTSTELYVGDSFLLKTYLFPENRDLESSVLTFASSNETIATVEPGGKVNGKAVGPATITVSCGSVTAECKVNVIESEVIEDGVDPVMVTEDGVWLAGFEESLTYTGAKVTQNVRIYDHKKLLKEKTDYVITYANNINAAPADRLKSPSMTITMKGQYYGKKTMYFAILPRDIAEADITTNGIAINYNKKVQKYVPVVTYNGKKLANKRDYSITYYSDSLRTSEAADEYLKGNEWGITPVYYRLTGLNANYDNSNDEGVYCIVGKSQNLSKASVSLAANLKYTGKTFTNDDLKLSLKMPGEKDPKYPFDNDNFVVVISKADGSPVNMSDIKEPGTYTVKIRVSQDGEGYGYYSFAGSVEKKFRVTSGNTLAKYAMVDESLWTAEIPFDKAVADDMTGLGLVQPNYDSNQYLIAKDDVEIDGGNTLVKDTDYTVTYLNNRKAGTAKIVFKGIGRFTGSISKTYKITKGSSITATVDSSVTYLTGGAIPNVKVTDENGATLVEKKDYTVSFLNNKAVGDGAIYKITGKGNYAGTKLEGNYSITPASIDRCKVVLADKPYNAKAGAYKSVPAVYDINGKKLTAGKDYDKNVEYYYVNSETDEAPAIGTEINVKITGLGNFAESSVHGYYRVFDKITNVSKLQIVIDPQYFTGRVVEPELYDGMSGAIHIYKSALDKKNGNEEIATNLVRIVSYSNNTKSGTGKVTLAGINEYGGSRTVTFKIKKKEYMPILVDKISMTVDPESAKQSLSCGKQAVIYATVEPENAENKTIIWTTSNSKLVRIDSVEKMGDDTHYKVTVTAVGNGAATIKATSQGSGKFGAVTIKAKKILPSMLDIQETSLSKTVEDGSYQLTLNYAPEDAYLEEIQWISSASNVVGVDNKGLLTFKRPGFALITVRCGNVSDYCMVTVSGSISDTIDVTTLGIIPGDGVNDSTKINNAINTYSGQGKTLYFPAGTYDLTFGPDNTDHSCIYVGHGKSINFELADGAIFKAPRFDGSVEDYNVVRFDRSKDCVFNGGKIIGDRDNTGSGASTEGGMGIGIMKGENITISNVDISRCWGDGIWIGDASRGYDGVRDSYYITLVNCNVHNNRRNNLSMVGTKNAVVVNCKFNGAGGKAPQFGVDIEPNGGGVVEHVNFINCEFLNNASASVGIITSANDVEFKGCKFDGMIYNMAGHNIRFVNCVGGILDDTAGGATVTGSAPVRQ